MKRILVILITTFSLFINILLSQNLPVQDCIGAKFVTQLQYIEDTTYIGSGLYPNEINKFISCLAQGEKNSIWYKIFVLDDGLLNFSITPHDNTDDFDWAVYNITNSLCSDIFHNPSLEIACNFVGTPE
ncbi:MAG: hypothetical protein IPP29_04820 [Bacteroidetes bacterium]|nr:hypothetical protein [Bacteroidota bacterium]